VPDDPIDRVAFGDATQVELDAGFVADWPNMSD
jgi:hypothetical protein